MKKQKLLLQAVTASLLAYTGSAQASNITISDPNIQFRTGPLTENNLVYDSPTGKAQWFKGDDKGNWLSEYREVEPGTSTGGGWDLVAFSYNADNSGLSILSGFDLINGNSGVTLGHLFIKLNPPPGNYPDPYDYPHYSPNSDFGYDLAVTFDFNAGKYYIYELKPETLLENAIYWNGNEANAASNPYKVASSALGGLTLKYTGNLAYDNSVDDSEFGALAGFAPHRAGSPDLGPLETPDTANYVSATLQNFPLGNYLPADGSGSAALHLTMSCGNDNLMGYQSGGWNRVPDGGATLTLLGLSLAGFSMIRRRIKA